MAEIQTLPDTENLPERYHQYVATQSRVSDWVSQTQQRRRNTFSRRGSKSSQYTYDKHSTNTHPPQHRRPPNSRKTLKGDTLLSMSEPGLNPLSPAIALISSSLVVCAFLPSLLAVSAFVVFLTWVSTDSKAKDERADDSFQWIPGSEKGF